MQILVTALSCLPGLFLEGPVEQIFVREMRELPRSMWMA